MAILKKGENTKAKIFQTAIQLFREKGYDNVSVEEIVALAKIAKGTFYIYFPTKAHVVAELFEEYDCRYAAAAKKIYSIQPQCDQLAAVVHEALLITTDIIGCDLTKVAYQSQLGLTTKSTDENRQLYKTLSKIIAKGQECGEFNSERAAGFYAMLIVRNLRGTIYEWCMTSEGFDLLTEGTDYMNCIMRILK